MFAIIIGYEFITEASLCFKLCNDINQKMDWTTFRAIFSQTRQEPILLQSLQLQRQRSNRIERFFSVEENILVFKAHYVG
jgi:hypothetical protein